MIIHLDDQHSLGTSSQLQLPFTTKLLHALCQRANNHSVHNFSNIAMIVANSVSSPCSCTAQGSMSRITLGGKSLSTLHSVWLYSSLFHEADIPQSSVHRKPGKNNLNTNLTPCWARVHTWQLKDSKSNPTWIWCLPPLCCRSRSCSPHLSSSYSTWVHHQACSEVHAVRLSADLPW